MLSFQEIGGSPKEVYSYDGFQATRTFLVPWEQRSEFALSVFGRESDETSSKRLTYPGRKDVVATQLTLEPFDSSAINVRELFDPKTDLVDYDGSYAKIIVRDTFEKYGLEVTFNAKPVDSVAGNGKHTHMSIGAMTKDGFRKMAVE